MLAFHFVLGLLTGSFANVVIARVPAGLSVVKPRSRCPKCQTMIAWYDNIPVISYALLKARCRSCKVWVSPRYPLVELLMASLFMFTYSHFGISALLYLRDLPFVFLCVCIAFIDLDHRIIPDELNLIGAVIGLATAYLTPDMGLISAVIGSLAGFFFFYLVAWLYEKRTGRMGLGGGDIKLLGMLGAFVGPVGLLVTVMISSILGTVIGTGYAFATRSSSWRQVSVPYGPFLVFGALIAYFGGTTYWLQYMTPT